MLLYNTFSDFISDQKWILNLSIELSTSCFVLTAV